MYSNSRLDKLLAVVFDRLQEVENSALYAKNREEFIFHMTDWSENLEELVELYRRPQHYKPKEASRIVAGFLYHVIPHLKAAGRLLLDEIPDAFDNSQSQLNLEPVAPSVKARNQRKTVVR